MRLEDDQCVYYTDQGEIKKGYNVHFLDDDPLPAQLKKVGFFNDYPTPSCFLGALPSEDNKTKDTSDVKLANTEDQNSEEEDALMLNNNSHTFHKPSCKTLNTVDQSGLQRVEWSREQVIEAGYRPCRQCNP